MKKGKVIRISVELVLLCGALFFLYKNLSRPGTTNYPGQWIPSLNPECTAVRKLFEIDSKGRLLAGLEVKDGGAGTAIYLPDKLVWRKSKPVVSTAHIIMDFTWLNKELWGTGFLINAESGILMKSADRGFNWEIPEVQLPGSPDPRCIETAGGSGDVLLLGSVGKGIFRSTDGGSTWTPANDGLENLYIQCIVADSNAPDRVFTGTIGGMYFSEDAGVTWTHVRNGLPDEYNLVIEVTQNPSRLENWYSLCRDASGQSHVMRSTNSGKTWSEPPRNLPHDFQPRCIELIPDKPDTVLLGTVYDGVYRSDDAGVIWSPMNRDLPTDKYHIIIHALLFDPVNRILYAGTDVDGKIWEYKLK